MSNEKDNLSESEIMDLNQAGLIAKLKKLGLKNCRCPTKSKMQDILKHHFNKNLKTEGIFFKFN